MLSGVAWASWPGRGATAAPPAGQLPALAQLLGVAGAAAVARAPPFMHPMPLSCLSACCPHPPDAASHRHPHAPLLPGPTTRHAAIELSHAPNLRPPLPPSPAIATPNSPVPPACALLQPPRSVRAAWLSAPRRQCCLLRRRWSMPWTLPCPRTGPRLRRRVSRAQLG